MSYQYEREEFVAHVTREGLSLPAAEKLLRCATTINRLAELACSSEEADRDQVWCPGDPRHNTTNDAKKFGPCLCDGRDGEHGRIPRIRLQDWQAEQRALRAVPAGWRVITEGDPRGHTLKVIPPSYTERNAGKDRFNLDAIGVPSGPSRLRW